MKQMKNKNLWIIIAVIVLLGSAVAVFAILNAGNLQEKQESQDKATVQIITGSETKEFDLAYLKTFEKIEFEANLDKSGEDPVKKSFAGVPLSTVLDAKDISLDNANEVVFKAADGYTSVVSAVEAKDKENIYLVYERGGKPSGSKQTGGSGPIEIVIRKDPFSQRWCKFLMSIEVQ